VGILIALLHTETKLKLKIKKIIPMDSAFLCFMFVQQILHELWVLEVEMKFIDAVL